MKAVLKHSLALVAAVATTSLIASQARAELPTAGAVVGAQYGYAAFEQSLDKAGAMSSTITINGFAAYAVYMGMKDIQEAPGTLANTKVKVGENISCTMGVFNQATCTLAFEALQSGKFAGGH